MAAKVILTFNDETVGEFLLDKESMTIGRRPTSDIYIDNLAVSGTHARILTILEDSFLEDLESTNGVFVNGQRVKKHALQEGDVVIIGKHELRFYPDEASSGVTGASEGLITPSYPEAPIESAAEEIQYEPSEKAAAEAATSGGTAKLRVITDGGPGKELLLTKSITTVGKPGVQVAAISRRPQGDFIVNVERGEGTKAPLVNGAPLGHGSLRLEHQDVIEIAGVKMEYLKE